MRPRLYINVDHVATLRQARQADEPDPARAALAAETGGADGITFHLREDRRHIRDADVTAIAGVIGTVCNFELAARDDIVDLACQVRPYQATLVPERRQELTTEGGLDLSRSDRALERAIARLQAAGARVSLFIDPDRSAIEQARHLGVPAIELHTGRYSQTWRSGVEALDELRRAATRAHDLGLAVHAGHGLAYDNVQPVARIAEIEEFNIGHSIISRAVFTGIGPAVAAMKQLIVEAHP